VAVGEKTFRGVKTQPDRRADELFFGANRKGRQRRNQKAKRRRAGQVPLAWVSRKMKKL